MLRDGRGLGYAEYGQPEGEPGFSLHGQRGSRLEAALDGMRRENRVGFQLGARFPPLAQVIMWSMELGRPWGFRLEEIERVVLRRQGEADALVPPAMGRHLAAAISNCQATSFPGEGHLLFDHMPEIARAFAT